MKKLTEFQLSCGYVQQLKIGADRVDLYKEHHKYHVRRFADFVDGQKIEGSWLVFDTLIDARKAFQRQYEIAKQANK